MGGRNGGKINLCQRLFLAYAVDGDGDGKKDIWQNQIDIFASMANYLKKGRLE